jgi:predicted DNA-binding transcriptional regulator AlpA
MELRKESLLSPRAARALSGGISESTQRRLIAAGQYPPPVVLSRCRDGHPARVAYVESEVRAWVAETIHRDRAERPAPAPAPASPPAVRTCAHPGLAGKRAQLGRTLVCPDCTREIGQ